MYVPFYPFGCAWTNQYCKHVPRARQWLLIFSIQKSDTYPAKQDLKGKIQLILPVTKDRLSSLLETQNEINFGLVKACETS